MQEFNFRVPRPSERRTWWFAAVCLAFLAPAAALAEYRLGPGDVLELTVATAPELRLRAAVGVDGEIGFPLVGSVKVGGRLLSEVRAELRAALPSKSLRRPGPDGRETDLLIEPDEITLNVAEYRPVYVSGDVLRPGEQPYRPSMTVRQVIAVAGGLDPLRRIRGDSSVDPTALRADYNSLRAQLAFQQSRVARLESELAGKPNPDLGRNAGTAIATDIVAVIARRELELQQTREADQRNEKNYLNSAVRQAQGRLSTLSEQQKKEDEGVRLDAADVTRIQSLFDKGQVTIQRLTDSRRALLLSSTRQLQTFAQAGQIELQRDELSRRLQKLDDARRMEVLEELQTASVQVATLRAKLESVSEQLLITTPSGAALSSAGKARVIVYRSGANGEEAVKGSDALTLLPGDVVEVTIEAAESGDGTALQQQK